MAEIVFILCAIMSVICTVMLLEGYRKTRNQLLLWSGFCFLLLAIDNTFLCVDLIVFPLVEMHGPFWRNLMTAVSGSLLLFGLIMELS
jgi:hypothetical protein